MSLVTLGSGSAMAQSTSACISPLNSDFYSRFSVAETAVYLQTNAAGPFFSGSNAFGFTATVNLSTNLTASAATLTVPGKKPQPMTGSGSRRFTLSAVTNTFANLNSTFPDGAYSFVISNKTTSVNLPSGSALPNGPNLLNYDAAQSIDPTKEFLLSWESFQGGGSRDSITVDVADQFGTIVFASEKYGCPGALDGSASSIVIPANTLSSNQNYRAELVFIKVLTLDTNSLPRVALLAGTETETQVTLATAAGTVGPPVAALVLTNVTRLPGGSVRFDLTTTPAVTYTVEFNQDLGNPAGWLPLLTTQAIGNSLAFTNDPPAGAEAGFYRASHN